MTKRIVDVFLKDRWVASYPVTSQMLDTPISDRDFIALAKNAMKEDGHSAEDIDDAKFNVRSVPE